MPTVTFSIDDDVLRRARKVALERNTTVTQMLREFLEETARPQAEAAKRRAEEFMRVTEALARNAGGEKFNREELYDRDVLRRY